MVRALVVRIHSTAVRLYGGSRKQCLCLWLCVSVVSVSTNVVPLRKRAPPAPPSLPAAPRLPP